MLDEPFRRALPRYLGPVVQACVRTGIRPDHLTVAGTALGVAAALLLARGAAWGAVAVWLLSRVLDGLDGLVARATQRQSAFGGFLDITLDMVAYGAMVLAFQARHPEARWLWPAILLGYLLVVTSTLALASGLAALARRVEGNTRSLEITPGLAEAGETTIAYVLMALVPSTVSAVGWSWVGMLGVTVVQRLILARRLLA